MDLLLCLAAGMIGGLLLTRLVRIINLPNVTAYLIAGLLMGPYFLGVFTKDLLDGVNLITTVALGFIAFSIGAEFKKETLKQVGKKAIIITIWEGLTAVFVVDIVLISIGVKLPLALTLGAIAAATAPAATLMVVRQYKANGAVTQTLLPVVAMDDALGLTAFSISFSVSKALDSNAGVSIFSMAVEPIIDIFGSLALGFALGLILALLMRFFASRANRMCLIIAMVFIGVSLSDMWSLSPLLLCMMMGATLTNIKKDVEPVLERMEQWTPPIFLLFFVISGADLDLAVLPTVGLIGALYIICRSIGKYLGASIGARIVKSPKTVQKYLGVALLPQAGVAIGMAQLSLTALPEYGEQIRAIILCGTLIYELVGPVLTRLALTAAGEIERKPKELKEQKTKV